MHYAQRQVIPNEVGTYPHRCAQSVDRLHACNLTFDPAEYPEVESVLEQRLQGILGIAEQSNS